MPGSDKGKRQERETLLQGDGIPYEDHRAADVMEPGDGSPDHT